MLNLRLFFTILIPFQIVTSSLLFTLTTYKSSSEITHLYYFKEDDALIEGTVLYISTQDTPQLESLIELTTEFVNAQGKKEAATLITTQHQLLYLEDNSTLHASGLHKGLKLMKWNGKEFGNATIVEVEEYNKSVPTTNVFTSNGWLLVNGFKVSNYENRLLELTAIMNLAIYDHLVSYLPNLIKSWFIESYCCLKSIRLAIKVTERVFGVYGFSSDSGKASPEDI